MGIFTPFKRRPKEFNYIPRHYDPVKESLEQRREELSGKRSDRPKDEDGNAIYVPGDYIRTKREARARNGRGNKSPKRSMAISVLMVIVIVMLGIIFAQRFVEVFTTATTTPEKAGTVKDNYEEFDPYAPITIVPNDYDPSKDK